MMWAGSWLGGLFICILKHMRGLSAWRVPPQRVPVLRDATLAVRGHGCAVLRVAMGGERVGRLHVRD